jgi:hypothetical protein
MAHNKLSAAKNLKKKTNIKAAECKATSSNAALLYSYMCRRIKLINQRLGISVLFLDF